MCVNGLEEFLVLNGVEYRLIIVLFCGFAALRFPFSKSKVAFLTDGTLMDDFEDEPLRWRKKGSNVKSPAVRTI